MTVEPPRTRVHHRAGPIEDEDVFVPKDDREIESAADLEPDTMQVQRCLRCDRILWTDRASGPPKIIGKRVATGTECPAILS